MYFKASDCYRELLRTKRERGWERDPERDSSLVLFWKYCSICCEAARDIVALTHTRAGSQATPCSLSLYTIFSLCLLYSLFIHMFVWPPDISSVAVHVHAHTPGQKRPLKAKLSFWSCFFSRLHRNWVFLSFCLQKLCVCSIPAFVHLAALFERFFLSVVHLVFSFVFLWIEFRHRIPLLCWWFMATRVINSTSVASYHDKVTREYSLTL